jgi:hypothetical protein
MNLNGYETDGVPVPSDLELTAGEQPFAIRQTRTVIALEAGDIEVLLLAATFAAEHARGDHAEQITRARDWLYKQAVEATGHDLMTKAGRWPAACEDEAKL